MLQNHARRHHVAVNRLSFSYEVEELPVEAVTRAPTSGCLIHGLYIEGARWDRKKKILAEPTPRVLHEPFPMLALKPQKDREPPTVGVYVCPCYKTLERAGELSSTGHSTSFVLSIELPSDDECRGSLSTPEVPTFSPHWIKRGVALFLSLDA